jgi:hypothetical protein
MMSMWEKVRWKRGWSKSRSQSILNYKSIRHRRGVVLNESLGAGNKRQLEASSFPLKIFNKEMFAAAKNCIASQSKLL